jgi:hypothetical protein
MEKNKMFKNEADFKKLVSRLNIDDKANPAHRENLRRQMLSAFDKSTYQQEPQLSFLSLGRIIMKSKMTKLAAAAAIIIAAGIFFYTTNYITPAAYALQDTIDAYNTIRSLHIKMSSTSFRGTSEIWLECDSHGNMSRIRYQAPDRGFGSLTIVENNGKSEAWLPRKNVHLTGYRNVGAVLGVDVSQVDPKGLVERLYQQEMHGEVILDVSEPKQKDKPIVVSVTYPKGSLSENWKKVIYVDQGTKLVKKIDKFELKDGQYQLMETRELLDYNQQINPVMFSLEGEIPSHVKVIDMAGVEIGMLQGDMTDEEAANEITRQFFEAAVAKDYTRLGQLFLAGPAYLTKQVFEGINQIKITSIEPAKPRTDPDKKGFLCSGKLQFEAGGLLYELNLFELPVGQINTASEPNRWMITGFAVNTYPFPDESFKGFLGFENGLTGWSSLKGSVSVSSDSHSGSKACRIEGRYSEGAANSPHFPVTAGKAYKLKSYVKLLSGAGDYKVTIAWLNNIGFPIRYDNDWAGKNRPASYTLHGGTFVAPEGAVLCTIMLGVQPGSTYLFDDIEFVPSLEE